MPAGCCVLKYEGKRATVWSIKYVDAAGARVRERLGRQDEGWNRKKAEAELRDRVVAVEKRQFRKPGPTTFEAFVEGFVDRHCDRKGLKRSTRASYATIMNNALVPAFGHLKVAEVTYKVIEAHLDEQVGEGVAPATLHRQLALLSLIFREAQRQDLVQKNPVRLVERPKAGENSWRILNPVEIAAVAAAFTELIGEAEEEGERAWRRQARVIFLVALETGMRRAELQGLRWRCVHLADPAGPRLRVEETWTRNAIDTPKSKAGVRTITLHKPIDSELFDHRGRSVFSGEDERVFCSSVGGPFDAVRYGETFKLALAKAGITDRVRPLHDLRHASITNGAAAGMNDKALQKRAGHSSSSTTALYVHLAGVEFADEDAKLAARLWGTPAPAA